MRSIERTYEQTELYTAILRKTVSYHLGYFIEVFLKHHFQFPYCDFHTDMFDVLSKASGNKRLVIIAPRGHGKTTITSFAYPLWLLATRRKRFVLILCSSIDGARERMQTITQEIDTNDYLLKVYPQLAPLLSKYGRTVKQTQTEMLFANATVLKATGLHGSLRGMLIQNKRPDMIIVDDPEKDSELQSPAMRDKTKRIFSNAIRYLSGTYACDIILIDTLRHFDSLVWTTYNTPGWQGYRYSAVKSHDDKKVLWDSRYVYSVNELDEYSIRNHQHYGQPGFEDVKQPFYGTYTPVGETEPSIVGLYDESPASFDQEYLSQPASIESMPLRRELWQYYTYNELMLDEFSYRVAALDLSMGVSNTSDFQAIAVTGYNRSNLSHYLLDASLTKIDLANKDNTENNLARLCVLFIKLYKLHCFYVETNASQGLFKNSIAEIMRQEGITYCRLVGKPSKGDKDQRIALNLGVEMQSGRVFIRDDWAKVYNDFMKQVEYFPNTKKDAPDAFNMAIMQIRRMAGATIGIYK